MFKLNFWIILIVCVLNKCLECQNSENDLISVVGLFRHGARAPRFMYKNDPHRDKILDVWPEGLTYLTHLGKNQQYMLGKWLRDYYKHFIPERYDSTFLKVMSSDKDRCLMSAAVNLAALFPPKTDQIWNPDLLWQPIPIHTTPKKEDLLFIENPCKTFDHLYSEVLRTEYHKKYLEDNKDVFEYLTYNTGENITKPEDVSIIHDTLFVEANYNLTLPEWTKKVFPHRTLPLAMKVYTLKTHNTALARLKSGPLIDLITAFFENVIENPASSHKLLLLSAHDSTIGPLLSTLGVFDNTWPECASIVLFELRSKNDKKFLNILFKNSTGLRNIKLNDCKSDCDFGEFRKITAPFRITITDKRKEC